MRVIMMIEVQDEAALDTVNAFLQEGVECDRLHGFFTLVKDGKSQAADLPPFMIDESLLAEAIAAGEQTILKNKFTGVNR